MPKLNLQKRERVLLAAGSALIVLMFAYAGAQGPWKEYRKSGTELLAARERLVQAQQVRDAVVEARQSHEVLVDRIRKRGGFNLWTFLTGALEKGDLVDRATLNNQRGLANSETWSGVQMTLEGVSLEELVKLLHHVYSSDNLIALYSLEQLRPTSKGRGLECRLVFVSPKA